MANCTACDAVLPPGTHWVNCERCRNRKKYVKADRQKKYHDMAYDNPHYTEREVTLDAEIECPFCGDTTTLRAVRDRQHKCWGRQ